METASDAAEPNASFTAKKNVPIDDIVVILIVQRACEKYGIATALNHDSVAGGPFEGPDRNIANWNRAG